MSHIIDETVFQLTADGDKELQWRTHGIPKDIRFLLMLINGTRDVRTLRLVSESARESNAVFEFLLAEGLIAFSDAGGHMVNATERQTPHSVPVSPISPDFATTQTLQYQTLQTTSLPIEQVHVSPIPAYMAFATSEADVQTPELLDPAAAFSNAFNRQNIEPIQAQQLADPRDEKVSSQLLSKAIAIVRQGLGRDADAMIEKLAACQDMASFSETVSRIEQVFRAHISTSLADELGAIAKR